MRLQGRATTVAGLSANGSIYVFAQWIGQSAKAHHLNADRLSALAPYQCMSAAQLKTTLRQVGRIRVKEGLVRDELPHDRRVFLERGSLQLQTQTGFVLVLNADTPQARYPLPLKPAVVSLYAAEPCTLLTIPLSAEAPTVPTPPPVAPRLDPAETDALCQLEGNFRKQRCELPSLPDLAWKIGKAIDDPHNDNEDIARLIQLDPSLTARLMSIVNSPAFVDDQLGFGGGQAIAVRGATDRDQHLVRDQLVLPGYIRIFNTDLLFGHLAAQHPRAETNIQPLLAKAA